MADKKTLQKKPAARKVSAPEHLSFNLFLTITQAINETEDFQSAIAVALRNVCESTGWDYAEAWIPSADATALERSPVCYGIGEAVEGFRNSTVGIRRSPGLGLIGRVWSSKQPEWIPDVSVNPGLFYRSQAAREAGLKAAFGLPILAADQVVAVLAFFMFESREEDKRLVEIVSAVATQLGSVLQHKRTDEALRESERRFHAIFDQTFQFVGLLSPDGTLLEANQTALKFRGLKRSDVVGRPFWETPWWDISRETQDRLKAAIAEAAQGKFVRYEVEHRDFSGEVGTFDFSLKPISDDTGKVVLVIAEGRNITDRKRAEKGLRESEERYRQLVELSPYAIFLNHEGKFFFVNSAALELYRAASPEQLIGKPIMDVVHPDYRALVHERIRRMLEHGITTPLVEQKSLRLDGTEFDVEVTAAPLIYEGKRMIQVVARDITVRKRAERALRESEARLQAILDNSTAVIYVKDTQGRFVLVNREFEKLFHATREQIIGKSDYDIFPKEMADAFQANDLKVIELGTPIEFEETAPHNGGVRTFISNKFPLYDSAGVPYALCGISTDITERKRAEEREILDRKRAETWLRSLVNTTQDAFISIDRQGRIVLFNPAAERMFGHGRAEIQGQKFNLLIAEPYASEYDSYITRHEPTGQRHAIDPIRTVVARRRNGEVFPVELAVTEVAAGESEEARYGAFFRDISEKVRLQEQLIETERLAAIGTTAAKLAHEIGNPLNGMYMTVQLLERRLAKHADTPDDTVKSPMQTLKDEITHLNQLLHEFRSLSRREKYNFRPTALAAVAGEVLYIERPRYATLGIEVEEAFPADLHLVMADSEKLKQALLNLCNNAVEAMPQGGTLTLRAHNAEEQVVLEVVDTGLGIPDGVDIFEPFATTKTWGTGLGLVIVRQIVSAHGGTITYASERGKGTVFCLSLPLRTHPTANP